MHIKTLICLVLSLSIFSSNYALADNTSKKTKTTQKKYAKSKKNKSNKKDKTEEAKAASVVSEEKLNALEYKCEENQKFTILGKVQEDNNITVNFGGNKVILTRVETDTGANRFINQDKGLDFVHMPSKSMLMNTKLGRRMADNCQSPSVVETPQTIDKKH